MGEGWVGGVGAGWEGGVGGGCRRSVDMKDSEMYESNTGRTN